MGLVRMLPRYFCGRLCVELVYELSSSFAAQLRYGEHVNVYSSPQCDLKWVLGQPISSEVLMYTQTRQSDYI